MEGVWRNAPTPFSFGRPAALSYNGRCLILTLESLMSRHFPRRVGGLTIIQTMAILAILGVILFFALSLLKKEMAPAATFKTLQGEQITTASLRGKVVMCAGNA
jgi:hypothetical protein